MSTKTFNVSFATELADQIDARTKKHFGSRSDFLRVAAIKYLREEDEWEELMAYGKLLGTQAGDESEAAVASDLTAARRKSEAWRRSPAKHRR